MAFSETNLSVLLQEKKEYLYKRQLFIAGDSAYPLCSYLIVPYPNAAFNSYQDAFNYWHSSSRINIECTFGEIVMRWGILWRRLQFSLESSGDIINACCHLHNFLIDQREDDDVDDFETDVENRTEQRPVCLNNELVYPLVTDNNEPDRGGRPRVDEQGIDLRYNIAMNLMANNMKRPHQEGMKYNRLGNVYMDY